MNVNKIENNNVMFSSKVRIQPELIEKMETQSRSTIYTFMDKLQKLKNNDANDIVVLTTSTDDVPYMGHPVHRIIMQIFEKKDGKFFKSETPVIRPLSNIGILDGKVKPFKFDLDNMYKKAKENMVKLSINESKFYYYI